MVLKDHAQMPIFQVDLGSYVGILQAENSSVLNSQLTSLQTLQKEHLLKVNEQNFSVQLKLGYAFLNQPLTENSFNSLLNEAEKQGLPQVTPQLEVMPTVEKTVSPSIEAVPLDLTIEHFDHTPHSSLLQQLRQN